MSFKVHCWGEKEGRKGEEWVRKREMGRDWQKVYSCMPVKMANIVNSPKGHHLSLFVITEYNV